MQAAQHFGSASTTANVLAERKKAKGHAHKDAADSASEVAVLSGQCPATQALSSLRAMQEDSHPYYPSNADVPGYHPPSLNPFAIGLIFIACSVAVVALAWRVSGLVLITPQEGCVALHAHRHLAQSSSPQTVMCPRSCSARRCGQRVGRHCTVWHILHRQGTFCCVLS